MKGVRWNSEKTHAGAHEESPTTGKYQPRRLKLRLPAVVAGRDSTRCATVGRSGAPQSWSDGGTQRTSDTRVERGSTSVASGSWTDGGGGMDRVRTEAEAVERVWGGSATNRCRRRRARPHARPWGVVASLRGTGPGPRWKRGRGMARLTWITGKTEIAWLFSSTPRTNSG